MNEKTKQILRYVACGLGGVALGIGLLGGLAMCASSGKSAKAESLNTIYTSPKKTATTNPTSGITSYTFDIQSYQSSLEQGTYRWQIYEVDTTNYNLTKVAVVDPIQNINASWATMVNTINQFYANHKPSTSNEVRFLQLEGLSEVEGDGTYTYWTYLSFMTAHEPNLTLKAFIAPNVTLGAWKMDQFASAYQSGVSSFAIINATKCDYILHNTTPYASTYKYHFVDIASYYQSQGWEDGYDAGESAGNSSGYADGYGDGYDQGYTDGDNVGYWAGYNEGIGTASSFTDISGNLNAVYDLTTMGTLSPTWQWLHGLSDVKIHTLLQFFDNDQNSWDCYIVDGVSPTQPTGTRTMYVDVAQLSSTDSQTIGFAVYTTASNVGLQEVGTAHFEFAQIRNVNNKSLTNKLILLYGWTQNDTSYQAGYQAGLKDGFDNTNTNNVFSLFTSAFNAVGGFFNLKIFGFLPLYWFFLTPLFVAIITLLLRMVKH